MKNTPSLRKGPGPDPTRAVHGFVIYLAGYIVFGVFIVWAYVPPSLLHSIGLTYWPQRYWAVVIPVYATCAGVVFFIVVAGYNLLCVEPLDSIHCIQDTADILPSTPENDSPRTSIPKIQDISIDTYCKSSYKIL
ncbi:phosphatidylinositol N-acetylglucosaminyltransferase subunit P-like [Watersipora subatra]|uniref:phosphatidylinositol N-acetylglucosaminyltransferase subunit P-like n=1 Tax=Watersipora subatra TaxID=2589382 RepID=UPI00355BF605